MNAVSRSFLSRLTVESSSMLQHSCSLAEHSVLRTNGGNFVSLSRMLLLLQSSTVHDVITRESFVRSLAVASYCTVLLYRIHHSHHTHSFIIHSNYYLLLTLGAKISASDISDSMAGEAARRAKELGITSAKFYTSDLESVQGKYDTVTCVDVAIHYPTDKMAEMVGHLCSLADDRVLISFAPKTWFYSILKKVGELFPGPSKTTRAYLHEEDVVRAALKQAGFEVAREEMTATNFYFSRLLEAKRI